VSREGISSIEEIIRDAIDGLPCILIDADDREQAVAVFGPVRISSPSGSSAGARPITMPMRRAITASVRRSCSILA
jgi:hypothetical protein